ncbi:MAG: RICIN domain-containing protein [Streptosporangiaceae bacterium]
MRLGYPATLMLAASLLTAGTIAATATGASANTTFASCSGQGSYAICDATGTANSPVTITVTVTSSPDQAVYVAWDAVCSEGDSAGSSSGSFTAQTPVSRTITHPYHQPDSCIVSADAQLQDAGNSVHLILSYSQSAPAPGPAVHQVKGYAGMCADDSGDSGALRAKVVAWKCSAGGPAESWKFTGGKLIHGSLCANDQAGGGSGSHVILYTCNGGSNEIWSHLANGEFKLRARGGTLCLDDPRGSTSNGTQLILYTCKDSANQRWSLP